MRSILERDGGAAGRVAAKVAGSLVPVRQHPALALVSVDDVNVARRAMRVAVYQAWIAMRAQHVVHRGGGDVHDLGGLQSLGQLALLSKPQDLLPACGERLREKTALRGRIVGVGPEFLV